MRNSHVVPPLIVVGMHRSGTSMISRMLEDLGIFMGKTKDNNHEAVFFLEINKWLVRQAGGSWDNPEAIQYLLADARVFGLVTDYIRRLMRTPHVVSYMGWKRYLRYGSPENIDAPWGWKDPRTVYTLPVWLDMFPAAKVIHVHRNGVDVARSLQARSERALAGWLEWRMRFRSRLRFYARPFRMWVDSVRCLSLEGSFLLWTSYMRQAEGVMASLPADKVLSLRYEHVLQEPAADVQVLCQFADLRRDPAHIASVASGVRSERALAYKRDGKLRRFYEAVKDTPEMIRFGYGSDGNAS